MSSHMRIRATFCVAVFASVLLLQGQSNLTGLWVFRAPVDDGTFRETFFDLQQAGEQITGAMLQGRRRTSIAEGWARNGKLHFALNLGGPNGTIRVETYDGDIAGGKLTRGNTTGAFERTSMDKMVPARIPPPSLHDVPDNGLVRTPPMGWNSWNKFAGRVTAEDVRGMADAMVSSGMAKAGYIYVNIDDTWELGRDAQGNPTTNKKFPDMKALADYVHSKGLKIGIYSGPGPKTCAGYEGSYGHEEQDARQYAAWGIDYLKYDWCSADQIYTEADMQAVYQKMGDALQKSGRPIVYSLCQYGRAEVWKWGPRVGGNLWRTTGDISDRWASLNNIGFGKAVMGKYSQLDIASAIKPGAFNDPDMLEIGNGGMNGDEYRLHMSLWSMLAAPLLAGNDLRTMTDEIKTILTNAEVIAIDQDKAVKPPKLVAEDGSTLVLSRLLADGAVAVGLFNRGDASALVSGTWDAVGLGGKQLEARDLWTHQAIAVSGNQYSVTVPAHGVVLLRVRAK